MADERKILGKGILVFFGIIPAVAGIAQLVEHLFCKQGVTSSSLVASTMFCVFFNIC